VPGRSVNKTRIAPSAVFETTAILRAHFVAHHPGFLGSQGASRGSSSLRGGGHWHAAFPWRASGPKLGTLALATARAFRQSLYVPHPLAGTRRWVIPEWKASALAA
jgi:hypothetical protein